MLLVGIPGEEGPGDDARLGKAPGELDDALAAGSAGGLVGNEIRGEPFPLRTTLL